MIWDWNGTLFDDFDAVLSAMNTACASAGGPHVSAETYRLTFTRPIETAYERLLGRALAAGEWARLNELFHSAYEACYRDFALAPDAVDALEALAQAGVTQSLLSMWDHDELVPVVKGYGVDHYFVRIDGQPGRGGGFKREHLETHLAHLASEPSVGPDVEPADMLLVGDSLDDADAAGAAGVPYVLLDSGPHTAGALAESGARLARSLVDALRIGGALD